MTVIRESGLARAIQTLLWLASCKLNALWRLRHDRRTRLAFQAAGLAILAARLPGAWASCGGFYYPPSCGAYGPVRTGNTFSCCSSAGMVYSGGQWHYLCCQYTCTQLYCAGDSSLTGSQAAEGTLMTNYMCVDPPGTCTFQIV